MIGAQDEHSRDPVSDITITPLVDVMLVLLVIFMLTAPLLMPQSLDVQLPRTASVKTLPPRTEGRLLVDQEGQLRLDGHPVQMDALPATLAGKSGNSSYALSIEADEHVRYGRVAQVLAIARAAGVSKISFVTTVVQTRP